ncbi:MAG: hypothetical protein ABMA64_21150 [Myxococcota bacterium]
MQFWIVLLGCGKGGGLSADEITFVEADIAGSGWLKYDAERTGDAFVRFGTASGALDSTTPTVDAAAGSVELRGLVNGRKHYAELVFVDGGDEQVSEVVEFTVSPPPDDVPILTQNEWDAGGSCLDGGYVLFNYIGATKSGVVIVDRLGQYVWGMASESPAQVGRARPGRNGQDILWNVAHQEKTTDIAAIIRQPFLGGEQTVTRTTWGHHDFVELPDGEMAWSGYDIRTDQLFPNGVDTGCIAAEVLYRGPEGMTEADTPTPIWNTWDDYTPGIYTFTAESDTFLKNYDCGDGTSPYEFQHANSLGYVESEGAYYQYWRWLDTLVKISAAGELLTEWGGPTNELTSADPSHEHAHFSDVWAGNILLYNNGHRIEQSGGGTVGSSVRHYTFDDTSYALETEFDNASYDDVLGDVRRIPVDGCENLLVSYSKQGRIVELTPEGEIVWEIGAGIGQITGRVYFLPDLYDFSGVAYPE